MNRGASCAAETCSPVRITISFFLSSSNPAIDCLPFFSSHCAVPHRYKNRECRAGDEVWEWGRGRTITGKCSSEGVCSEFYFFPHIIFYAQIHLYCTALLHHVYYKHNFFQQGTVISCDYWKMLGKFCWWFQTLLHLHSCELPFLFLNKSHLLWDPPDNHT